MCSENIILPRINYSEGDWNDLEEPTLKKTKKKKTFCVQSVLWTIWYDRNKRSDTKLIQLVNS